MIENLGEMWGKFGELKFGGKFKRTEILGELKFGEFGGTEVLGEVKLVGKIQTPEGGD